jgi:gentisate 1,2-dioxygenase
MQTETLAPVKPQLSSVTPGAANGTGQLLSELKTTHTLPLWAQMEKLNPHSPNPSTIPHVWRYDELRPHLLRAGDLISEKQAERRVLMLVNPARGKSRE